MAITTNSALTADELRRYIAEYRDRTENLIKIFPEDETRWRYYELSFYVSMIQKIHYYKIQNCNQELRQMEDEVSKHRTMFINCELTHDFEKCWANKYVTDGANFNNNFLFCITARCNKKCKYCMVFSPYLEAGKKQYHPSFEELCNEIDGLFAIIDSSAGIQFGGGEPCIRKDLPALIDYMGKYKDKISDFTRLGTGFGIITNSSIEFSDELIEASKRFGPQLCWLLDDYHFSIGEKIAEKLSNHGINYVLRDQKTNGDMHCGGWLNFFSDYTKPVDKEKAISNYSKCGQAQSIFQFIIANGSIYPCSRPMSVDMYWPELSPAKDCRVDIFDENSTKELKVEKLKSLMCANHYFTCGFCGGLHSDRKVRHYPAEQLSDQEFSDLRQGNLSMMDFGNHNENR